MAKAADSKDSEKFETALIFLSKNSFHFKLIANGMSGKKREIVRKLVVVEFNYLQDNKKWNLIMEARNALDHQMSLKFATFKSVLVRNMFLR